MRGQWIGNFQANYPGEIIANIDEFRDHFAGEAFFRPHDSSIPAISIRFRTSDKNSPFASTSRSILAIDPRTGVPTDWQLVKQSFPNYRMPSEASIKGEYEETTISINASTDLGMKITAELKKNPFTLESSIKGNPVTWPKFRGAVAEFEGRKFLFRGQAKPWRLRSSFHRRQRYDLTRFLELDIQTLYRQLSARTSHIFNLQIPDQNGAFFNLVRHHGYPTPIIDWTYSPYVAAFFAFHEVPKKGRQEDPVRIYILDHEAWSRDWKQLVMLNTASPHLSLANFLAIDNERMIQQQAASTVTNIDDVETYIRNKETERSGQYLVAVDMPSSDRNKAMEELSYMGITAASMFPSMDGTCEEIRERFFDN